MAERGGFRVWMLIPPALAGGILVAFLAAQFRANPDALPSAFVARPAPSLVLTGLRPGEDPPGDADIRAPGVKLVNFWASWCAPCRIEHPVLMRLKAEGVTVIGANYKDDPEKALRFLGELGDPFVRLGADAKGRTGIDWGIYGVPETFVIDGAGKVLLRYPGPLTEDVLRETIRPLLGR